MLKDYRSVYDATIVDFLYQYGPNELWKTNMDEFGMGSHSQFSFWGPIDSGTAEKRSVGGSSGGSALAVANGTVFLGVGTDTGGSVRLPAAYTGVVGFKPSYGAVPRYGVIPYANSLDTVGFMTRSASAMREFYSEDFMISHDSRDPTSPNASSRRRYNRSRAQNSDTTTNRLKSLKIGVPVEYHIKELGSEVRQAWVRSLQKLQEKGHTIIPISLPSTKNALSAYYVLAAAEAASNLAKYDGIRYGSRAHGSDAAGGVLYAQTREQSFGIEVKRRILLGNYTLSSKAMDSHFIKAQKVRRLVQKDFDRVFAMDNPIHEPEQFDMSEMDESIELPDKLGPAQVDVIVCPTAPTLPPTIEELDHQHPVQSYTTDVFTVPASLAGLPALSVPVKSADTDDDSQIRVGMQIIGQYWDDQLVLRVGELLDEHVNADRYEEQ